MFVRVVMLKDLCWRKQELVSNSMAWSAAMKEKGVRSLLGCMFEKAWSCSHPLLWAILVGSNSLITEWGRDGLRWVWASDLGTLQYGDIMGLNRSSPFEVSYTPILSGCNSLAQYWQNNFKVLFSERQDFFFSSDVHFSAWDRNFKKWQDFVFYYIGCYQRRSKHNSPILLVLTRNL